MKAIVNGEFNFSFDENDFCWDCVKIKNGAFHVIFNGKSLVADVVSRNDLEKTFVIKINNINYTILLKDKYDELLESLGMDRLNNKKDLEIKAPMPGRVLDVLFNDGDKVVEGDSLLVLEAMKMENVIKSPLGGIVKRVAVTTNQVVEKNEVLIEFE